MTLLAQPSLFQAAHMPQWCFGSLQPYSYRFLMADCPWRFELYSEKGEAKSAQSHYATMTTQDICALPVSDLAASDAVLFLWATWPMLDDARKVMAAWRFRYVSGGVWLKTTKNGKDGFGTGYRLRSACEPWLLGIVGEPETSRSHRNLIRGRAREHSRKPEEAYAWAESYLPDARRAELFSRTHREGWEAWGNEAGKFN